MNKYVAIGLIMAGFLFGCMAAFDLGARHSCIISGGTLLENYVCLINSSISACETIDGRFVLNLGYP